MDKRIQDVLKGMDIENKPVIAQPTNGYQARYKLPQSLLWSGSEVPLPQLELVVTPLTVKDFLIVGEQTMLSNLMFFIGIYRESMKQQIDFYIPFIMTINSQPVIKKNICDFIQWHVKGCDEVEFNEEGIILWIANKPKVMMADDVLMLFDALVQLYEVFIPEETFEDLQETEGAKKLREEAEKWKKLIADYKSTQKTHISSSFMQLSLILIGFGFKINEIFSMTPYQLFHTQAILIRKMGTDSKMQAAAAGATNINIEEDYWLSF